MKWNSSVLHADTTLVVAKWNSSVADTAGCFGQLREVKIKGEVKFEGLDDEWEVSVEGMGDEWEWNDFGGSSNVFGEKERKKDVGGFFLFFLLTVYK